MGYVQAGYSIVLGILFLYGLQLVWRRRKLNRAVARVVAAGDSGALRATAVPVGGAPAVPAEGTAAAPFVGDR